MLIECFAFRVVTRIMSLSTTNVLDLRTSTVLFLFWEIDFYGKQVVYFVGGIGISVAVNIIVQYKG